MVHSVHGSNIYFLLLICDTYLKRQGIKDMNIRIAAIADNTPLFTCANGNMEGLESNLEKHHLEQY